MESEEVIEELYWVIKDLDKKGFEYTWIREVIQHIKEQDAFIYAMHTTLSMLQDDVEERDERISDLEAEVFLTSQGWDDCREQLAEWGERIYDQVDHTEDQNEIIASLKERISELEEAVEEWEIIAEAQDYVIDMAQARREH